MPKDRVLVKNQEIRCPVKLRSYWQQLVYKVLRGFQIRLYWGKKRKDGLGSLSRLFLNLLFQCNQLPIVQSKKERLVSRSTHDRKKAKSAWKPSEESSIDPDFAFQGSTLNLEAKPYHPIESSVTVGKSVISGQFPSRRCRRGQWRDETDRLNP